MSELLTYIMVNDIYMGTPGKGTSAFRPTHVDGHVPHARIIENIIEVYPLSTEHRTLQNCY